MDGACHYTLAGGVRVPRNPRARSKTLASTSISSAINSSSAASYVLLLHLLLLLPPTHILPPLSHSLYLPPYHSLAFPPVTFADLLLFATSRKDEELFKVTRRSTPTTSLKLPNSPSAPPSVHFFLLISSFPSLLISRGLKGFGLLKMCYLWKVFGYEEFPWKFRGQFCDIVEAIGRTWFSEAVRARIQTEPGNRSWRLSESPATDSAVSVVCTRPFPAAKMRENTRLGATRSTSADYRPTTMQRATNNFETNAVQADVAATATTSQIFTRGALVGFLAENYTICLFFSSPSSLLSSFLSSHLSDLFLGGIFCSFFFLICKIYRFAETKRVRWNYRADFSETWVFADVEIWMNFLFPSRYEFYRMIKFENSIQIMESLSLGFVNLRVGSIGGTIWNSDLSTFRAWKLKTKIRDELWQRAAHLDVWISLFGMIFCRDLQCQFLFLFLVFTH